MDWARTAFVREVERAYAWTQMPGGGFVAIYPDPPAILVDAVMLYAGEVGAREHHEWEERRAEAERGNPSAG